MNRKCLVIAALLAASALPAGALQFTNVSAFLFPGLTNKLNAVSYGGSSNFVAVGEKEVFVTGTFAPNQSLIAAPSWTTNRISPRAASLRTVASSGSLFVATGSNNWISTS